MESVKEHSCSSCGASNATTAGFCWQCYRPFGAQVPAVSAVPGPSVASSAAPYSPGIPTRPGYAPMGMPSPVPAPPPPRSRAFGAMGGRVVGIVIGLAVGLGAFNFFTQTQIEFPDSVRGVPRITNQEAELFEDEVQRLGDQEDLQMLGAMYGQAGFPSFLTIVIESPAVETTDELFEKFLEGTAGAGVVVDSALATSGTREGADYRCVPIEQPITSACMWRDDDTVGVVMTLDRDIDETLQLLYDVRSASTD